MTKRQGPLWDAMEAAGKVLDINREGMQGEKAFNADVTPVVDLAKRIVEQCAKIADKHGERDPMIDMDPSYTDGQCHAAQSIADEIRALIE